MVDFFTWLSSAVGPLAKRVLSALGIGWLTFEGLGQMVEQAKSMVISLWGSGASSVWVVAEMAGIGTALGIILGAIVARVAYQTLAKLGKLMT